MTTSEVLKTDKKLHDFLQDNLLRGRVEKLMEEYHKKQLSLCSVVGSKDVQLMRDSMLKSREETARAREYSAIKQTLEIYCDHGELPTVNEVLERIGRKH